MTREDYAGHRTAAPEIVVHETQRTKKNEIDPVGCVKKYRGLVVCLAVIYFLVASGIAAFLFNINQNLTHEVNRLSKENDRYRDLNMELERNIEELIVVKDGLIVVRDHLSGNVTELTKVNANLRKVGVQFEYHGKTYHAQNNQFGKTTKSLVVVKNEFAEVKQELAYETEKMANQTQRLATISDELQETSKNLTRTSNELTKTSNELTKTSNELTKTKEELKETSDRLQETSDELKGTQQKYDDAFEKFSHTYKVFNDALKQQGESLESVLDTYIKTAKEFRDAARNHEENAYKVALDQKLDQIFPKFRVSFHEVFVRDSAFSYETKIQDIATERWERMRTYINTKVLSPLHTGLRDFESYLLQSLDVCAEWSVSSSDELKLAQYLNIVRQYGKHAVDHYKQLHSTIWSKYQYDIRQLPETEQAPDESAAIQLHFRGNLDTIQQECKT